jgi:tetratricopeptide (TPR) repeat protein
MLMSAAPQTPGRTIFLWCLYAGWAYLCLGKDEEAVALMRRSIESNRNYPLAHFWLAAGLAQLGRLEEARAAVQAGMVLDSTFSVARARVSAFSDNAIYLKQRDRVFEALRKAGVPKG